MSKLARRPRSALLCPIMLRYRERHRPVIVGRMGQCNRTAINVVIDVGYNEGPCATRKVGDMILHTAAAAAGVVREPVALNIVVRRGAIPPSTERGEESTALFSRAFRAISAGIKCMY